MKTTKLTFKDLEISKKNYSSLQIAEAFGRKHGLIFSQEQSSMLFDKYLEAVGYFDESAFVDDIETFYSIWNHWCLDQKGNGQLHPQQLMAYYYNGRHEHFITGKNVFNERVAVL